MLVNLLTLVTGVLEYWSYGEPFLHNSENPLYYECKMYKGRLDDFKIYSYALSHSELLGLADESQWYQGLLSDADLYEGIDEIVDFKDFAVLAGSWLDTLFWP